jgi:hypothetical protein
MLSATASRSRSFDQSLGVKTTRSPSLPSLSSAYLPLVATTAATSITDSAEGSSASSPESALADQPPAEAVAQAWMDLAADDHHLALSTNRIGNLSLDGFDMGGPGQRRRAADDSVLGRADDRPFRCVVPGCGKAYKNANGLKYHAFHGHADQMQPAAAKPYRCLVPGCGKTYKNANGLKYHATHAHTHAGFAVLPTA